MKRVILLMLALMLLLSVFQASPSLAQSGEVWFNVDVVSIGTYKITVYKDGSASGQGSILSDGLVGNYVFDGRYEKGSLSGTLQLSYRDATGADVYYASVESSGTLQLNLTDKRSFKGTYSYTFTMTTHGIEENPTTSGSNTDEATAQADRDIVVGEGTEEEGPEEEAEEPEETEASTPPGEDSNFRLKMSALKEPGEAYIRRAGSDKLVPADDSTVINFGDTIIIKKGFGAILNLDEDSDMVLRPGSELTVTKKNRLKQFGEGMLRLGEGIKNWFSEDETDKGFEIETKRANTSITGTVLVINDDGSKCSLKVIEGVAGFTDKASGKTVTVHAGEMIVTTDQGLGDITRFDAQAELAEWESLEAEILAEPEADSDGFPTWLLVVIIAAAVIILAVAVILVVKRGKK